MADDPDDAPLRGRDLAGLGGLLAGAVVAGTAAGVAFDAWAGTSPAGTLAGVATGVVAGCVGFWVRVRSALRG